MTARFNLILMLVEVRFNDQNMLLILEEVIFRNVRSSSLSMALLLVESC